MTDDFENALAAPNTVVGEIQRRLLRGERLRSDDAIDEYHCTRPLFFYAIRIFERLPGFRLHGRGTKGGTYWVERKDTVVLDFRQEKVVAAAYQGLKESREEDDRIIEGILRSLDEIRRRRSEQDDVIRFLAQEANGGDALDLPR